MAFITRLRVEVFTTLALLSTRETVAVETFARRATCSKFMAIFSIVAQTQYLTGLNPVPISREIGLDILGGSAYTPAHQGFLRA
jgi:hypothetical protein